MKFSLSWVIILIRLISAPIIYSLLIPAYIGATIWMLGECLIKDHNLKWFLQFVIKEDSRTLWTHNPLFIADFLYKEVMQ